MFVLKVRNVHEALPLGIRLVRESGVRRDSRNGPVLMLPAPLVTVYSHPMERVIFHEKRDANPYFHLMEAMWMLAGRNDVLFPAYFGSKLREYSDNGTTLHGAYGYRWRRGFGVGDQLKIVVDTLRRDPTDRRQVISMWDANRDLGVNSKDLPCNTHAYVQIGTDNRLNLMVCNRSNDMIWGTYGANAVHFAFLLEYLAMGIGVAPGLYTQVSMNTHVYLKKHERLIQESYWYGPTFGTSTYLGKTFDRDLGLLFSQDLSFCPELEDVFLNSVVRPMWESYNYFKSKNLPAAKDALSLMPPDNDWKIAATQWLERRVAK